MIDAAAPPLDRAHFAMMTADDKALQSEVAGLFRDQVDEWRAALSAPASPGWADALHKLKGSARGIGLAQLAQACEAAEQAGPEQAPASSITVLAALENALRALTSY
jgi:HPt (histidine-containing phosphotransfer) domain-containing protein